MEKYESQFSPGKLVEPHQFIAELICEKAALQRGVTLPLKFWSVKGQWATTFVRQAQIAAELCVTYHHESIVKALRDPDARRMYSLACPGLDRIIQKYESQRPQQTAVASPTIDTSKTRPQEITKPKTLKSKLRDL